MTYSIYIYIYIERERDIDIYVYIYIYMIGIVAPRSLRLRQKAFKCVQGTPHSAIMINKY